MKDIFKGKTSADVVSQIDLSTQQQPAPFQTQLGLRSFGIFAHNMTWELRDHFKLDVSENSVTFRSLDDGKKLTLSCVKKSPGGQWQSVKLQDDYAADPPYDLMLNGVPLSDIENKIIEHFRFWASHHYKGDKKTWDDAIDSACCQVSTINGQPSWRLQPL